MGYYVTALWVPCHTHDVTRSFLSGPAYVIYNPIASCDRLPPPPSRKKNGTLVV